jgi:hypothetical protein
VTRSAGSRGGVVGDLHTTGSGSRHSDRNIWWSGRERLGECRNFLQ